MPWFGPYGLTPARAEPEPETAYFAGWVSLAIARDEDFYEPSPLRAVIDGPGLVRIEGELTPELHRLLTGDFTRGLSIDPITVPPMHWKREEPTVSPTFYEQVMAATHARLLTEQARILDLARNPLGLDLPVTIPPAEFYEHGFVSIPERFTRARSATPFADAMVAPVRADRDAVIFDWTDDFRHPSFPCSAELILPDGSPVADEHGITQGGFLFLDGGTLDMGILRWSPSWRTILHLTLRPWKWLKLPATWREWRHPKPWCNDFALFRESFGAASDSQLSSAEPWEGASS